MNKVCCIEESRPGLGPPPGYKLWEVTGGGASRGRGWFSGKAGPCQLIYKESCELPLEDLEVVSFVRGELATGYVCSCDLALRILDPESLVAHLGSDQRVVTEQALNSTFAILPRLKTPYFAEVSQSAADFLHDPAFSRVCRKSAHAQISPVS